MINLKARIRVLSTTSLKYSKARCISYAHWGEQYKFQRLKWYKLKKGLPKIK